jgi:predicted dithiol-disulfide oxidoreductase (DUF899 family)
MTDYKIGTHEDLARRAECDSHRHRSRQLLSEATGFTAFVLDDGVVYQTYSAFARGVEIMMGFYPLLDRAPLGRNESGDSEIWIRRHDEY